VAPRPLKREKAEGSITPRPSVLPAPVAGSIWTPARATPRNPARPPWNTVA